MTVNPNKNELKMRLVGMVKEAEDLRVWFSQADAARLLDITCETVFSYLKELATEGKVRQALVQDGSRTRNSFLTVNENRSAQTVDNKNELLSYLRERFRDGYVPTFAEIKKKTGLADSTISKYLRQFKEAGLVRKISFLDDDNVCRVAYEPTSNVRDARGMYKRDTAEKKAEGGRAAAARKNRAPSALGFAIPTDEGDLQKRINAIVAKAQEREGIKPGFELYGVYYAEVSTHGRKTA